MKRSRIIKTTIIQPATPFKLDIMENGYIVLEDGIVAGVYPVLPDKYAGTEIEDESAKLLIPAFSDMHLHAPQFPMAGTGMDLQLLDWLNAYAFKTEALFADESYAREIYSQLAKELIGFGTTRVCAFSSLHVPATLILMEELEKAGISGYVGKVNMDRNSPDFLRETTEDSIKATEEWLERCSDFKHIKPVITPRFTPSCTNALMKRLGELARLYDLPVQSHLSENRSEMAWVRELHPDCEQYWQTYDKYELFNDRTVMAHCVYSDEAECRAMREHGVYAVHCADSNINIRSGVMPVRRLLDDGNRVLMGTDIAGGATASMMRAMTVSIHASKLLSIQPDCDGMQLSMPTVFYLATTAADEFFGEKPGFAVGKRLNALLLDDSTLPRKPGMSVSDRLERIFYVDRKELCAVV